MKNTQYDALVSDFDTFIREFAMQEALDEDQVRLAIVGHLEQNHNVRYRDGLLDDLLES